MWIRKFGATSWRVHKLGWPLVSELCPAPPRVHIFVAISTVPHYHIGVAHDPSWAANHRTTCSWLSWLAQRRGHMTELGQWSASVRFLISSWEMKSHLSSSYRAIEMWSWKCYWLITLPGEAAHVKYERTQAVSTKKHLWESERESALSWEVPHPHPLPRGRLINLLFWGS